MSIKNNANLPAFPISEEQTDRINDGVLIYTGLTKREYFAAMALQGLLADPNCSPNAVTAMMASQAADFLLNQLEKPTP